MASPSLYLTAPCILLIMLGLGCDEPARHDVAVDGAPHVEPSTPSASPSQVVAPDINAVPGMLPKTIEPTIKPRSGIVGDSKGGKAEPTAD